MTTAEKARLGELEKLVLQLQTENRFLRETQEQMMKDLDNLEDKLFKIVRIATIEDDK